MKILKKLRSSVSITYLWIFLFLLLFTRMDVLVCPPLWELGYAYQVSWWVLMSSTFLVVSLIFYSVLPSPQGKWFAFLNMALYVGGFLDFLYMLNIPFPEFWIDPGFIWFWNIFYIFLGYPWTIKEQILWWIGWALLILGVYYWMKKKYHIQHVTPRFNITLGELIGWILFAFGLGVLVHDYTHALWEVGGYCEILSLQGGYFGIIILAIGVIMIRIYRCVTWKTQNHMH